MLGRLIGASKQRSNTVLCAKNYTSKSRITVKHKKGVLVVIYE